MIRIIKAASNASPPTAAGAPGGGSASAASPSAPAGAAASFVDVSAEIRALLDRARQEAAGIVQAAQCQAEQLRRQAEQESRREAEQRCREQLHAEVDRQLATVLPALERVLDALQAERVAYLRGCEHGVLQLAIAIAERLIRRALHVQPEITLDLIREALELAGGSPQIRVRLHPADCERLQAAIEELVRLRGLESVVQLLPDAAVSPGGCLVQTESGTIDQRFESQLARIEEELS
jgi:flagellar biosynthesis/type III secretory pathway protein FliH